MSCMIYPISRVGTVWCFKLIAAGKQNTYIPLKWMVYFWVQVLTVSLNFFFFHGTNFSLKKALHITVI